MSTHRGQPRLSDQAAAAITPELIITQGREAHNRTSHPECCEHPVTCHYFAGCWHCSCFTAFGGIHA